MEQVTIDWTALAHAGGTLVAWCADHGPPDTPARLEACRLGKDLVRLVAVSRALQAFAGIRTYSEVLQAAKAIVIEMSRSFSAAGHIEEIVFGRLSGRLTELAATHRLELEPAEFEGLLRADGV
jgi:hypothetical protein